MVACDGRFELSEKNEGRVPKYTDVFKTQLVAESRAVGATAPMISKRHNVPVNRIYAWRQDERYQSAASEEPGFTAVEVAADRNGRDQSQTTCEGAVLHQSPDKRGVPLPVKMVSQLTQTWHSQVRSFC